MAFVPGERRQQTWPSTVVTLAQLIIHRYAMLGVLTEAGLPTREMGILEAPAFGYEPDSKGEWQEQADFSEPPLAIEGAVAHWNHRVDDDYYSQPGNLFRLLTSEKQQLLFENTARSVGGASREIQQRHVANCTRADPAYGAGVAVALERAASK